jgi:hypothetical protein
MGAFSDEMRAVATELIKEFGSDCVLTKVSKNGVYDPITGTTANTSVDFATYCAPTNKINIDFGDGRNANLLAFSNTSVTVAWFGEMVDATWLFNGQNIKTVTPVETQNDVVIFNLIIGEKD